MKSKTSFFNRAVFSKTFFRFWPIWGFYSFALIIAGPLAFMSNVRYMDDKTVYLAWAESAATTVIPTVAMILGLISAIAAFSYLFKTKRIDFYHSLPVTRENLFITNYISGFCFSLLPNIAITAIMSLFFAAYSLPVKTLFLTLAAITLATLFFYSLAVFCAMICGNIFAMPFAYVFLNFLAIALNAIVNVVGELFMTGFSYTILPVTKALTPVVRMYKTVGESNTEYTGRLFACFAIYAAVGLVLAVIAGRLNKIRKSEAAGSITAFAPVRYIFRYLLGFMGAYTVGLLLFVMICDAAAIDRYSTVCFIVFIMASLFGGLLVYYVFEMFSQKNFKVFKGSLRAVVPLTVAIAIVCACGFYDILGYQRRVPDQSDIVSVCYYDGYLDTKTSDPEMISIVRDIHSSLAEMETDCNESWSSDTVSRYISISYTLKNGHSVARSYSYSSGNMDIIGPTEQKLEALWSSDSAKRAIAEDLAAAETIDYFYVENGSQEYYDDGYVNGKALAQALVSDIRAGADIHLDGQIGENEWNVYFSTDRGEISFCFGEDCTNTMEYLAAVGNMQEAMDTEARG